MAQPAGFEDPSRPHFVCKLNKVLYGLKQAPRAWFARLRQTLQQWVFRSSVSDSSLFYSSTNGSPLFILIYVDDILITGENKNSIHTLIDDLNKVFAPKNLGTFYYFLGFEPTRTPVALHLCERKYVSNLLVQTNMAKPIVVLLLCVLPTNSILMTTPPFLSPLYIKVLLVHSSM